MPNAVVNVEVPSNGRIYAIGDVHGCYDALIELEAKIKKSMKSGGHRRYKILSVGDLCDRGPDTSKVIEHFVRGKQASTHDIVIGNHEMFFLLAFMGLRPDLLEMAKIELSWFHRALTGIYKSVMHQVDSWRMNGGDSVFRSYDAEINDVKTWDRIPQTHLQFLFSAPLVLLTPKAIISHAVMHEGDLEVLTTFDKNPSDTPERRVLEALHRCLWEREFPSARIDSHKRHISGHTPILKVRREIKIGAVQIDTGAVYGRDLTALNLSNFRSMAVTSDFTYRKPSKDLY
jgi:serine/threonine protein phosphatase 1